MARLTDDEIGELLRETFSEKEELTTSGSEPSTAWADHLPEATKRRRTAPAVLAAAAILAVVAGALYCVQRLTAPAPEPPVASQVVSDPDIWVGAIEATIQRFQPSTGWQQVVLWAVSDAQRDENAAGGATPNRARPIIMARVSETVPATWENAGTVFTTQGCRANRIAEIAVGNIVDKGDHKEVQITIRTDCAQRRVVTYLAYPNGELRASDAAGTPTRKVCIPRLATPANERAGC